jgi:hypothetical protein
MAVDSKAAGNLSCAFGLKLPVIFKTAFQVTVSRAVTQPNTTDLRLAACACDQEIAYRTHPDRRSDVAAALVLLNIGKLERNFARGA